MTPLALPCRSFLLLVFLAGVGCPVQSIAVPQTDFNAVPTYEEHADLMRKGISFHDQGDYDGAIQAYRKVLDGNPDDVTALYELTFSYFMKQDYANCIRSATSGTEYHSKLQTQFHLALGNCLDASGKPRKAVRVYRSALRQSPGEHLLHYNLAVTYQNLEKSKDASRHLKKAIDGNPHHASSHIALGQHYVAQGHRIPALLAFARFLVLEPATGRSEVALQSLHAVLGGQTSQVSGDEITIFMNPDTNTDEGDFGSAELMLSLAEAAARSPKRKDQTPLEKTLERFGLLFGLLSEHAAEQEHRGFAWNHYLPYFKQLEEQGFIEPLVYHTHQAAAWEGIREWIDANGEQMGRFLEWSRNYRERSAAAGKEQ